MGDSYQIDFGIWGSIFPVPCAIADRHLKLCSGIQLKVLLLALREGKSPVDLDAIAQRLGISPEDAAGCLDYWQVAGVFSPGGNTPEPAPARQDSEGADKPAPSPAGGTSRESAHLREEQVVKGQRITTVHSRAKLTPSQQNKLIREDPEIPQLLQLLQEVLNRPLTPYETEGFLYLYSGLRLPASYLLMAAQYSRDVGRDSIRQMEKLVTGWVERGIETHDQAEEEIRRLARCRENEGQVRDLFGIHGRNLSAKEKNYIEHWFTDLCYGADIIKLAYDRTVDNTGKVSFPYLNKILNRWHEKGVGTPGEALAEMEGGPKKPQKGGPPPDSSYDLEEIRRLMEQNSGG